MSSADAASTAAAPAVQFAQVSCHFGAVRAVDNVDLRIAPGEFFAMLGPSGSGKTTCLRLIAGFERPSSGRIALSGVDVVSVPPYRRNVNTVFQDYALFPHLSVLDNVAYGLMVRGVDKDQRLSQAEQALAMVKLPGYGARRPAQLSGGQRQRVALARAIINRPQVLLLDEPLGALDLKLREQMQEELKTLQRSLGITFVFVTHDQGEALSMADRVAVFNDGRLQQIGTPQAIYRQPVSRFVADFVGSSNVLPPEFVSAHAGGARNWASLRPEALRLSASGTVPRLRATLVSSSYLGANVRLALDAGGQRLYAVLAADQQPTLPPPGAELGLSWDDNDLHIMADAAE